MTKFAVMFVNISDNSNFEPKLVALSHSYCHAQNAAMNYLQREIEEIKKCSGIEIEIDRTGLHASDEYGQVAMQMSIQEIRLDISLAEW